MTTTVFDTSGGVAGAAAPVRAARRDASIDTLRGIAILMVIGVHSLQQPLDASWAKMIDAALRPCVPVFLFASGYLTAKSGRAPLWKRIKAVLIPYAIAFTAAYIYMSLHNSAMDHRLTTTVARFVLAYVFVYYYVFIYVGCTVGLWLAFRAAGGASPDARRLVVILALGILAGVISGSYLDPLMHRLGASDSLIEEGRLRDIPFWFSFAALGALVALTGADTVVRDMRVGFAVTMLAAYAIYAGVRIYGIGDAADYDSVAYFGYAALFCVLLFALGPALPALAAIGSGSYFIYLWHIFVVMALRDHAPLRDYGAGVNFAVTYAVTVAITLGALWAIRSVAPFRVVRWLGA